MKTDIKTVLNMKHFFKLLQTKSDDSMKYTLKKPSQILIKNIHINWLQYIHAKTHKQMPVYLNNTFKNRSNSQVIGVIKQSIHDYNDNEILEHSLIQYSPDKRSELQFDLFVPRQDVMQYFIKWQRYRKYWWSSVSTTPNLFTIHDLKYEADTASVDVVAQLPCGLQPVENITMESCENEPTTSCLSCKMSLEVALLTLLLDGLSTNTKEQYLRLHRKIAPFKISFALDCTDSEERNTLIELANLLYYKLETKKISSFLPDFTLSLESQIKENRRMGVTYTAVLNTNTLGNGIFKLLSSSTMLGEQVHVADFHSYAEMIFKK